jgi:CO/xanthine dehydrogenase Mo-binding subunit
VYTNNPPSGAFRGFGAPQALFAAEMQMNKLAQVLDLDPVEMRLSNLLREGSLTGMGSPLPEGVSLVEVTERCAEAAGWKRTAAAWRKPVATEEGSRLRKGWGLAAAFKNVGYSFGYADNCTAKIELTGKAQIESARVCIGSAEVGQGTHSAILQMAATALGLSPDKVRIVASDTATSRSSGSVSASRMTVMAGNAIRGAAGIALNEWRVARHPAIGEYTYYAPATTPFNTETGQGTPNFCYGYVAQAAEVEVNLDTGALRILRVICANDAGKAINPQQVEGQIEGGVLQAIGWVTCENFLTRDGRVLTPNLSTYLIPTTADLPEQTESIIVEHANPMGPWGARGMGELPFIALAPALVAAVHDATGLWFDDFPLTQERLFQRLKVRGKGSI